MTGGEYAKAEAYPDHTAGTVVRAGFLRAGLICAAANAGSHRPPPELPRRIPSRVLSRARAARKGAVLSFEISDNSGRRHAIKRTQFVAVGIAQVSEVHLAGGPLAHAGRVFDRRAAIRDTGFVPCLGLLGIAHREADRAAIGMAGRLAIDRLGHHETPAIVRITQPASGVLDAGLSAHRDKQGIVEFPRSGDVVTPDHDMAEHSGFSSSGSHVARRLRPIGRTRFAGSGQYDRAMIREREKSLPSHRHPRPPMTAGL